MIDKIGKINYTEKRNQRNDGTDKKRRALLEKLPESCGAIRIYLRRQRKRDGNRG